MSKLIVALDGMTSVQAMKMAKSLTGKVWGFKINDLLLSQGTSIITALKFIGDRVFADPKLFDIPTTVANCIKKLEKAGADLITVHASGGATMLRAATDESDNILAVTVLTSMRDSELAFTNNLPEADARRSRVMDLTFLATDSKCKGIICAARDLEWVEHYRILKVIPGIRPSFLRSVEKDDQEQHSELPPGDLLVVGRPITQAPDPVEVVELLNERINRGLPPSGASV